jgi:hypothetical protein
MSEYMIAREAGERMTSPLPSPMMISNTIEANFTRVLPDLK